jgi:glycosyltransferase involved in cell wall biosynthesis
MVFELASAQKRLGEDVEIWTPDTVRAGSTEHFEALPVRYFYPEKAFGLAKSLRMEKAFGELPRGSVLHAHCTYHPLNLQVGRAAVRHGHRAFYHPHGALSPLWLKGWGLKALKKRAYFAAFEGRNLRAAAGVFALTEMERDDLVALGVDSPLRILPNGIKPVPTAASGDGLDFRRRHDIAQDAPALLFIGRIVPLKKLEDIISVLGELKDVVPNLHLIIAGDSQVEPAYTAGLKARIAEAGVGTRVSWVGFLDENDKPAAYAAAQIFIHASDSEGMSMAILEAMSAGLPAVVTKGCRMAAAAKAGALIECAPGPVALAKAFVAALADGEGIGRRAADYVNRQHDWASLARQAVAHYAEVARDA